MSKLVIVVPAGRRHCGRLMLLGEDGRTRLGPLRVLATASGWAARRHGNAMRDWRRPFGHLPCGSYVVAGSLPPGLSPRPRRARRFGALGALILSPSGGDALQAAKGGRTSFLVHGGPPDDAGRLRPTFGGARLLDGDLAALLRAINQANGAGDPVSAVEVAEVASPSWTIEGRASERAGRLRPAFAANRATPAPRGKLGHAALVTLGFGVLRGRKLVAGEKARPGRRDFVGLALLTLGAIGTTACLGAGPDVPADDTPQPGEGVAVPGRRRARPTGDGGTTSNSDAGSADASGPEQDGGGPCGGYGSCGGDVVGGGDVTGGDVGGGG